MQPQAFNSHQFTLSYWPASTNQNILDISFAHDDTLFQAKTPTINMDTES